MTDLHNLLNWQIKAGSHDFPGPDGGTCINELACVVAGFKYRKIDSGDDMPECSSRVIATYALGLNDAIKDDAERTRLMSPFIALLIGNRDTDEVERQRAEYIALETARRILPPVLERVGLAEHAAACRGAVDLAAAARAAAYAADAADAAVDAADAAADAAYCAYAVDAAGAAAYAAAIPEALLILDGAMKIGKQPDPLDVALMQERADKAKQGAI